MSTTAEPINLLSQVYSKQTPFSIPLDAIAIRIYNFTTIVENIGKVVVLFHARISEDGTYYISDINLNFDYFNNALFHGTFQFNNMHNLTLYRDKATYSTQKNEIQTLPPQELLDKFMAICNKYSIILKEGLPSLTVPSLSIVVTHEEGECPLSCSGDSYFSEDAI
jgi:hypothetical protein